MRYSVPSRAEGLRYAGRATSEDLYIDSVQTTVGAYGVAMTLGRNPPHPVPSTPPAAEPLVVIRTSLEHAKIMAMLLRKQLKAYEEQRRDPDPAGSL